MADGGYIKLWRKLEQWLRERGATPAQKWCTVEMLLMANWRDEGDIPRGSFASSERDIARKAQVSRKVVRATQALLLRGDDDGPFISIVTRAQLGAQASSTYTIENYSRYQGRDCDEGPGEGPTLVPPGPNPGTLRDHSPYMKKLRIEDSVPEAVAGIRTAKRTKSPTTPPEDIELLKHCEHCLAARGAAVALPATKKNLEAVRAARYQRTQAQALALLTRFYALEGDVAAAGWPLAWFPSRLPALLAPTRQERDEAEADKRKAQTAELLATMAAQRRAAGYEP